MVRENSEQFFEKILYEINMWHKWSQCLKIGRLRLLKWSQCLNINNIYICFPIRMNEIKINFVIKKNQKNLLGGIEPPS